MSETADTLLQNAQKTNEQFDYYMMAITGALLAYLASNVPSGGLGSFCYVFYLISVILLLLAMYFTFMRVETGGDCQSVDGKMIALRYFKGVLAVNLDKLEKDDGYFIFEKTGETFDRIRARMEIERIDRDLEILDKKLNLLTRKYVRDYHCRNNLFTAGFCCLFVSRLALPYLG